MYPCRGVLHTPQKCPWSRANDSFSLYILGRIQYAPILTDKKLDGLLADDSQTRYAQGCIQYAPTHTNKKMGGSSADNSQTRYVLGRMQYATTLTDQKFDPLLSIESRTWCVFGCMQYAPTLKDQKIDFLLSIESPARFVQWRMQYAPTLTDQKFDSLLSIESPVRYILGRMQYAPTLTDQKLDFPLKSPTRNDPFFMYRCRGVLHTPQKCPWPWANDSSTRYVSIKYVSIESYTRQKLDSPLEPPTHNDPFSVYRCRGVWHMPQKCPWQWANNSSARYVSIKYVFIESFSQKGLDSPYPIESYTRQKLDFPLKPPAHNDPFSVYRYRGVLHTPHKCPWQWANESSTRYVSIKYVFVESFSRKVLDSPSPIESYTRQKLDSPLKSHTHNDPFSGYRCSGVLHTPHKCPWQWANESPARYVYIKYVLIESFSRKGLDSPPPIESYTRQKFDSPLKHPTRNDPFLVYRCRGVLHTPHKRPRQGTNGSICHPFFEYT